MSNPTCPNCGSTDTGYVQTQVRNGTVENSICDDCGHQWAHRLYPSGNSR